MVQRTDPSRSSRETVDHVPHWPELRAFLEAHPELIRQDRTLLAELGLKLTGRNVVEFGAAALSRLEAAVERESDARRTVEQVARANFAAQAQTHACALDVLEARNHSDLARRLDAASQARFGLSGAAVLIERPGGVPFGWRPLESGAVDDLVGSDGLAWLGPACFEEVLFPGAVAGVAKSVALIRIRLWEPGRAGLVAFASPETDGFTRDMGCELIAFIARVVERAADRWPALEPVMRPDARE